MQELERLEKNNTLKCIWPYILKIVSENPVHAYQLRKRIEQRFGFRCGRVTAYHAIYRLTSRGFVTKKEDGRKIIYSVTPKGRRALKDAIAFYRQRIKLLK